MKFMRMQMLRPWALQCLMGDGVTPVGGAGSRVHQLTDNISSHKKMTTADTTTCKLFKPDGQVCIYHSPIRASLLMTDFPKHLVCRSDSFYIGQKVVHLSENDQLQLGHTYFLLPAQFFQSTLTFVTIASFASSSYSSSSFSSSSSSSSSSSMELAVNKAPVLVDDTRTKAAFLKKAAASTCPPFDMQKTAAGALTIRVSGEFISQLMVDRWSHQNPQAAGAHDGDERILLCTTPQLQKDYKQLVIGSRGHWKPKLEMIKETNKKGKKVVFLSASFKFGMQRLKKRLHDNDDKKNKKKKSQSQPQSCSALAASAPMHAATTNCKKKKKTGPKLKKKRKSSSSNSDSDHNSVSSTNSKLLYAKNSKSAEALPPKQSQPEAPSTIHQKPNHERNEDQASSTTSAASSNDSRSVSPGHDQHKADHVNGHETSSTSAASSNVNMSSESSANSSKNSKPVGNCCPHPAHQPIVLQKSPSASPRVLEPKSSNLSSTSTTATVTSTSTSTKNSTAKSLSKKFRSFGGRSKPLL